MQASNEGNLQTVPKKKLSMGGNASQPPMKKAREGSPGGGSPASSGPGSARSPGLEQVSQEGGKVYAPQEEGDEGPQLSVKREFASGRDNPSRQEAEDEDGSNQGQGNLLDCLMQVRPKHLSLHDMESKFSFRRVKVTWAMVAETLEGRAGLSRTTLAPLSTYYQVHPKTPSNPV